MIKKRYLILIPAFFILVIIIVISMNMKQVENFVFSKLKLDQGNAFISISKNNIDGYNRWIPFYFYLETDTDLEPEEAETLLNENIAQATLYSDKQNELFTTTQLIWSAYKLDAGSYNLTLVLIPELDQLDMEGVQQIDKIILRSDKSNCEYDLSNYLIEARDTIPEDQLYVSLSSMESQVQDDLTAQVDYGFKKNGNDVNALDLDFPSEFTDIVNYKVNNATSTEEDTIEYSVSVLLNSKDSKTVFRPFLKVEYNNTIGWLIPSVPVYFK